MSRERSLWAWGWANRFPGDDARRALAQQVAGTLGVPEPALRVPPTLASIRMPEPRAVVPPELAAIVSVDRRERALHAHGKGYRDVARAFTGDFSGAPDAVALPRDEEDVARILAWCERD